MGTSDAIYRGDNPMPCLPDLKNEFAAGRFAGRYRLAETELERQKVWKEIPSTMRQRVTEMLEYCDRLKVLDVAEKIATTPRLNDRRVLLNSVESGLRERVKKMTEAMFQTMREKRKENMSKGG
jgi:hypothetical protein